MGKAEKCWAQWQTIADRLLGRGWEVEFWQTARERETFWLAAAEKDGKKYIVSAQSITTAFLELETGCLQAG